MENRENFLTKEISNFKNNYSKVFSDYLLCFISALIACVAGILLINGSIDSSDQELLTKLRLIFKLLLITSLGIPLFFAIALFNKVQEFSNKISIITQALGVSLLVLYFFTIETENYFDITQYAIYSLALHLFAAFAPIRKLKNNLAFWQYNLKLLQTFIITNIFTGILALGISLALEGIRTLLGVEINYKVNAYAMTIIFTLFNTFRFLSLVDTGFENYSEDYSPKLIQILTSYALIPLSAIYTVILYAYMIMKYSVTDEWELELGFVIFFAYSVLSLLIVLLSYNRRSKVKWVDIYSKYLPYIMLPLLAFNMHKINIYIGNNFLTISIYFLLVYSTWLFLLVMYNFKNKFNNIKIIPISLSIICFLISIGPWSFTNVSIKSAQNRIIQTLDSYKVFENFSKKEETQMKSLDYLELTRAISAINDVEKGKYLIEIFDKYSLKYDLKKIAHDKVSIFNHLDSSLMIEIKYDRHDNNFDYIITDFEKKSYEIKDYNYIMKIDLADETDTTINKSADTNYFVNNTLKIFHSLNGESLNLQSSNYSVKLNLKEYYLKLTKITMKLKKDNNFFNLSYLPDQDISYFYEDSKVKLKIIPLELKVDGLTTNGEYKKLDRLSCYLLFKTK
mgnify:CR=1 FL=1